jgi:hypothetical protein
MELRRRIAEHSTQEFEYEEETEYVQ